MARSTSSNKRRYVLLGSLLILGILGLLREESFIINVLDNTRFKTQESGIINVLTGNLDRGHHHPQNIFFDDDSFTELLAYSASVSSNPFPSSWLELNDQLFCPIQNSKTLNPRSTTSNGDEHLLRLLYDLQFKEDCFSDDEDNKFLVFDLETAGSRGLGAVVNAGFIKFLFRALYSNRTLLVTGKWSWSSQQKWCRGKPGMECYALPSSNCDYQGIRSHFGAHQEWEGPLPLHCNLGDNQSLPLCNERIITVNQITNGWGYFPRPSTMDRWLLRKYRFNYNVCSMLCRFSAMVHDHADWPGLLMLSRNVFRCSCLMMSGVSSGGDLVYAQTQTSCSRHCLLQSPRFVDQLTG